MRRTHGSAIIIYTPSGLVAASKNLAFKLFAHFRFQSKAGNNKTKQRLSVRDNCVSNLEEYDHEDVDFEFSGFRFAMDCARPRHGCYA